MMITVGRTEYWSQFLQEWRDSGCSQKEFCQQKGISYSTFQYWRRKEKENDRNGTSNDILHAVEVSSTLKRTGASLIMEFESHGIVVSVFGSDATVTVNGRINLEQFERIIAACSPSGKEM